MWLSSSADGDAQSKRYNVSYMYLAQYHTYEILADKASNFYFEGEIWNTILVLRL
jgi:hypothetical protein